jgi:hypothetical protein
MVACLCDHTDGGTMTFKGANTQDRSRTDLVAGKAVRQALRNYGML